MLVLVNGNKFKIDRQQYHSTSNFVSANSLIAKFIRYDMMPLLMHQTKSGYVLVIAHANFCKNKKLVK